MKDLSIYITSVTGEEPTIEMEGNLKQFVGKVEITYYTHGDFSEFENDPMKLRDIVMLKILTMKNIEL